MTDQNNWERDVLEKLAMTAVQEQRRARHWSIFFKVLTLGFMFTVLFIYMGWVGKNDAALGVGKHTALVELQGVIASDSAASADNIIPSLQDAFKDKGTQGVILRINSPGGSPVQAGQINDEILRLRAQYPKIPLYVVVDDICASGGYYVAVAADKIFVDKASLIGSIGVLMDGFGFTGTMAKLGVERRLITAGANKGFPRSIFSAQRHPAGIRQTDARGNPPAIHRCGEEGPRQTSQGNAGHLQRFGMERTEGRGNGLGGWLRQPGVGGARCHQGREHRGLHHEGKLG